MRWEGSPLSHAYQSHTLGLRGSDSPGSLRVALQDYFPLFLLIFAQGTHPIACFINCSKLSCLDQFPSIQRSRMVMWPRGSVRSSADM